MIPKQCPPGEYERDKCECPFCGSRAEAHYEFLEVLDTYPYGYWAQCGAYCCEDCEAVQCSPSLFLPNREPETFPQCKPEAGLTEEEDRAGWHRGEIHTCMLPLEMRYHYLPPWYSLRQEWLCAMCYDPNDEFGIGFEPYALVCRSH